ncbi:MAG: NAD-dependent epimerase/dehydratase family protein [Verrucomicrobiae bacterium]|nr:NAD-dependent epimerase/dehydratase family protein [Verrucomicrobiae bacterium]
MSLADEKLRKILADHSATWLVTGAAGFIGSHLVETLLLLGQRVVGLDNFSAGKRVNLRDVEKKTGPEAWRRFQLVEGDVTCLTTCREVCRPGVDYVLHHAALCSVPLSIENPRRTHDDNVTGHLNMLIAAREARVRRVVYASSSAVYGDCEDLPCVEERVGRCLSPYALGKCVNELNAGLFHRLYGLPSVGLRYFNVYGPRQDPAGAYAAVIPKWIDAMMRGGTVWVNGDGKQTRDFCFVTNVVEANLLAATVDYETCLRQAGEVTDSRCRKPGGGGGCAGAPAACFNVALGQRIDLLGLFEMLKDLFLSRQPDRIIAPPSCRPALRGEVCDSCASIVRAERALGYIPTHNLRQGLAETVAWHEECISEE